ncbi:MAG TPA: hypothetical protein VIY86_09515, partial [Pirellulaceae bacterium]
MMTAKGTVRCLVFGMLVWGSAAVQAVTISSFSFEQLAVGPNNSPAPNLGAGMATPLGMTNNFTTPPSVTNCDVLTNAGSSNPLPDNKAWRIRSTGTGNGNGWAAAAPQYSQGAEFLMSTGGYQDIQLTYDWFPTTQGVKHQQVQYTSDGATWQNVGPLVAGPGTEAWVNGISIDFSGFSEVNNNALFGVRIVSAYAPDGPNAGQYVNLTGAVINSTSGNWRFDNIQISGNVIPEPGVLALSLLGALFAWPRGRR